MDGAGTRRACSEHGFVVGERCPTCGDETYDLETAEDRGFLQTLIRQRRVSRLLRASGFGALLAFLTLVSLDCAAGLDLMLAQRSDALLLLTAGLTLVFDAVLVAKLPKEQRAFESAVLPSHTLRRMTGAPVVALVVCVIVFAATVEPAPARWGAWGGFQLRDDARVFAVHPLAIRAGEQLWTLLSAGFLHAQLDHLLGNLIGLLVFGSVVDLRLGRLRAAAVLLLGVALGDLAHACFTAQIELPAVGISTGVFALAGCYATLLPDRGVLLNAEGRPRLRARVAIPIYALGFGVILSAMLPGVAWIGHLAGFLVGALLGLRARKTPAPAEFEEAEIMRAMQAG